MKVTVESLSTGTVQNKRYSKGKTDNSGPDLIVKMYFTKFSSSGEDEQNILTSICFFPFHVSNFSADLKQTYDHNWFIDNNDKSQQYIMWSLLSTFWQLFENDEATGPSYWCTPIVANYQALKILFSPTLFTWFLLHQKTQLDFPHLSRRCYEG